MERWMGPGPYAHGAPIPRVAPACTREGAQRFGKIFCAITFVVKPAVFVVVVGQRLSR